MDHLWTPWRYSYVTNLAETARKGVPSLLDAWPGEDAHCVFCNLIRSVDWAIEQGMPAAEAEQAGHILLRRDSLFVCLNAFPYSSGHLMVIPYRHTDSLAALRPEHAAEMITTAQQMERTLRAVYKPDGINLGMNLGKAAGAGVAGHIHLHILPRWVGDTNFMTVTAETRILPELLEQSYARIRQELATPSDPDPEQGSASQRS
jgi:ATP adenylyltransferase